MLARTDSRIRAVVMLIVASLVVGLIGGRLVWWQVIDQDGLADAGLAQLAHVQQIPATRGLILDRSGLILATSVAAESVFATPPTVEDPAHSALLLSGILGMDVDELTATLSSDAAWTWLVRRVDPETATRVRALNLPGIGLISEPKRVYTMGGGATGTTLASQLLGFVNVDGVGQYGVEAAEDPVLAGTPGSVVAQEDVVGRLIAGSVHELDCAGQRRRRHADPRCRAAAHPGAADRRQLHQEPRRGRDRPDHGRPHRGDPGAGLVPVLRRQRLPDHRSGPVQQPGGQPPVRAGLGDEGVDRGGRPGRGGHHPGRPFIDDNNLHIYDAVIHNADRAWYPNGHGLITPAQVLALSNNVGAAKIGLPLGRQPLYEAFLPLRLRPADRRRHRRRGAGRGLDPDAEGPRRS